MASLTIRNLEEPLKARLRVQAATHGQSMEAEAREILRTALVREAPGQANLFEAIRACFTDSGGVELELPAREAMRDPPTLD